MAELPCLSEIWCPRGAVVPLAGPLTCPGLCAPAGARQGSPPAPRTGLPLRHCASQHNDRRCTWSNPSVSSVILADSGARKMRDQRCLSISRHRSRGARGGCRTRGLRHEHGLLAWDLCARLYWARSRGLPLWKRAQGCGAACLPCRPALAAAHPGRSPVRRRCPARRLSQGFSGCSRESAEQRRPGCYSRTVPCAAGISWMPSCVAVPRMACLAEASGCKISGLQEQKLRRTTFAEIFLSLRSHRASDDD